MANGGAWAEKQDRSLSTVPKIAMFGVQAMPPDENGISNRGACTKAHKVSLNKPSDWRSPETGPSK
jgi:hypothetical protein